MNNKPVVQGEDKLEGQAKAKAMADKLNPCEVDAPEPFRTRQARRFYPGECYQRAVEFVTEHSLTDGIQLVYGRSHGTDHAWVELPGDIVFDGVTQGFYSKGCYYETWNAIKEKSFSVQEVWKLWEESKHYGPW